MEGVRCYLGVAGGFQSPLIMGSRSFARGITPAIRLEKGATLPYQTTIEQPFQRVLRVQRKFGDVLAVYPGPEYELLKDPEMIYASSFKVSRAISRMGYRLDGPPVLLKESKEMLSLPVSPGTVQLTPSGQLVVLMRDAQPTGGYPRIFQLTLSSITLLAQKWSGVPVFFLE